jgi:hypothetical protein
VRLRRKIAIAFFLVSSLVSVLLALFLYRFIEDQLEGELRSKLLDMAHIGAAEIDHDAFRRLHAQLGDADETKVATIEASSDYRAIAAQLQFLRRTEPELMQYAYLLAPSADPNSPRFVVEADVLDFNARIARDDKLPEGESVSQFALLYYVAAIPLLRQALAECTTQLEKDFVWDEKLKVNSVSAYVSLSDRNGIALRDDKGRCLGVLGLDITDRRMRAALENVGGLEIRISLAMIVLALIYDLWGDTVNTASRIESHGIPGRGPRQRIDATAVARHVRARAARSDRSRARAGCKRTLIVGKRPTMKSLEPRLSDPRGPTEASAWPR